MPILFGQKRQRISFCFLLSGTAYVLGKVIKIVHSVFKELVPARGIGLNEIGSHTRFSLHVVLRCHHANGAEHFRYFDSSDIVWSPTLYYVRDGLLVGLI